MYRENSLLEIVCVIIAIIMIFVFIYASANVDLGASAYEKVNQFLIDVPSVEPLVIEALSDGVLTLQELNDIKDYVDDESKRALLSKIAEVQ
ncbi:hypothetical protein LA020_004238 [Vibrio alginolyticus]|nr:hypothetical protein [Vibrio alginolyticus]